MVALLESTAKDKRQRMIDVGMKEDPDYTQKLLNFLLTFEDVISLPDLELAEVLAKAPPRVTAFAISKLGDDVIKRFLTNAKPKVMAEIRSHLEIEAGPREIGGAQLKLIEVTRELEKKGYVKCKKIPETFNF